MTRRPGLSVALQADVRWIPGLLMCLATCLMAGCGLTDDGAVADPSPSGKADDAEASGVTVEAFDDVELDPAGRSQLLEITVPEGSHGMHVTILGAPTFYYLVAYLEGPDGVVISDSPPGVELTEEEKANLYGQWLGANRAGVGVVPGFGSALVPNNPSVALTPGTWKLQVMGVGATIADPAVGTVDVRVAIKGSDAPPTKGTLNVSLHFGGGCGLTSTTWHGTVIEDVIQVAKNFLTTANIDLVIQEVDDVTAAPAYDVLSPDSGLGELFATSSHPRGIDVFVVAISSTGIAGMSAGIPGPALTPGSYGGGVVLGCRPTLTTLGHELGHYLGLYHTVELDGSARDQLDDTKDAGIGNAMKPDGGNAAGKFSAQQAWVLHRNPLVIQTP